jgi:hypothetical protein
MMAKSLIKLKQRGGENVNLIEKVYKEMSTDADGNDKQAEILKNEYIEAPLDQQKAIDRVFIALCGWSLRTLIKGHKATESYNPYK